MPMFTPSPPRAGAAAMPRPSAMPPEARTGSGRTASTTCGISPIVQTSPQNLPDSGSAGEGASSARGTPSPGSPQPRTRVGLVEGILAEAHPHEAGGTALAVRYAGPGVARLLLPGAQNSSSCHSMQVGIRPPLPRNSLTAWRTSSMGISEPAMNSLE